MADDQLAEIRQLYFKTTRKTIDRDFDRAIDLLKTMPEDQRHRATVFMEGLAQMRKEFKGGGRRGDPADGDDL
jgi:glutamate mutase epsilon subunit